MAVNAFLYKGESSLQRSPAGRKYSCFEGGIRVPFVVSDPGIRGGTHCDVPVVQWDLLATLHDLSGNETPLPDDIDGGSLKDVFFNGNKWEK